MNDVLGSRELWSDLIGGIGVSFDRWIVYGDFNVVLNCDERWSKSGLNFNEIKEFSDCVNRVGFVDL